MATLALAARFGLFGDEVYSSSDLNRRSAEVLDHARKTPVTISRNKEQFALMRREQVAELVRAIRQVGPTFELLQGALSVVEGKEPPSSLTWLKAFDLDDTRKMIREILTASISALETGDWETATSVVHEWHESALAELSGVLDEAMRSPSEEVPLTEPMSVWDRTNIFNLTRA